MTGNAMLSSLYREPGAHPDERIALWDGEREISRAQLQALVARTAAWAHANGVRPGDKVALWLVNRVEWLAWLFALARLGAAVVAVNTRFRSHELQYLLNRSGARMLVMQSAFREIDFPGAIAGVDPHDLPALESVVLLDAKAADRPARLLDRPVVPFDLDSLADGPAPDHENADDPAVLFTTSGTTKGPKLVVHTGATLTAHSRDVARRYELDAPSAVVLAALPLCGVFGLNSVLAALGAGVPLALMDTFDAAAAVRALQERRVTHWCASDEMIRRVAAVATGERPFPYLRLVGFAAFSSGSAELAQEMARRGIPLRGLYGSSEVQALFSLQPGALPLAERALGGGLPSGERAQVRVRDPDTGTLCGHDAPGELEISSATRFIGYLGNAEATAAAHTADGYFRTGDLGYTRTDGSFVYLARIGDAMRLGGFLVDPSEIEHALTLQPGVAAAQVVAVELQGVARPVAFVRAADAGLDAPAVLGRLKDMLARFKVPARIWVVDEFPATASANGNKVQRVKLREMAIERLAQELSPAPR